MTIFTSHQTTIAMSKIKLVVLEEHTLGYIHPEMPNSVGILHTSILKGSSYNYWTGSVILGNKPVRLATEDDFTAFRCVFDGYKNDSNYEYAN